MTFLGQPVFILTDLNLIPHLINRLVAIKSLLDLGDMELVVVAASRLDGDREHPEIAGILGALESHRYAEAADQIDKLLSDGTRLVRWTDPEITLLEAELEQITAELADTETELAELEHLVSRFQAAHNEELGWRISKLLKLRMRLLERKLKASPEERETYEQARQDYEEFENERETHRETDAKTKWDLSNEQQAELKSLFRKGSKRCHPDLVPAEHHAAASQMFRELRKAYDEGDLDRLRKLVERADAGLFEAADEHRDSDEQKKARLKARIAATRESLERTQAITLEIRTSSTYQTMTEHPDWADLFNEQGKLLDQEIEKLSATLMNTSDDDT